VITFSTFERIVRLRVIGCLAVLSRVSKAKFVMIENGIFSAIESSFVFTDPELFSETFLLINCLCSIEIPDFVLKYEFFCRFPLLLNSVAKRGLKFILNFFRIVLELAESVILETGILKNLIEIQKDMQFESRRVLAIFFAEILDWIWFRFGESDLFMAVFQIVIEICQDFPRESLYHCLYMIDRCMNECQSLRRICERLGFWDELFFLTDSSDEIISLQLQFILDHHYWPYEDARH
jgi:hypothetical protein